MPDIKSLVDPNTYDDLSEVMPHFTRKIRGQFYCVLVQVVKHAERQEAGISPANQVRHLLPSRAGPHCRCATASSARRPSSIVDRRQPAARSPNLPREFPNLVLKSQNLVR